jgi:hypothetical protein
VSFRDTEDLASRRVQVLGSTPHPETLFMQQVIRTLTMAELESLDVHVLIGIGSRAARRGVSFGTRTFASC